MKIPQTILSAVLAAGLPLAVFAKTESAPPDVVARFEAQIGKANEAYNRAKENYEICRREVAKYDNVLGRLRKLADNYESVRSEYAGYRNEIDSILEGALPQERVDVLTNQFSRLQARVRAYKEDLGRMTEESSGGPYESSNREFEGALKEFLEASRAANELTYAPGSSDQFIDLATSYREAFGTYGAVNLDNVIPDENTRLGALRVWRDGMHGFVHAEMLKKLNGRGDCLKEIADDAAEIGEALGNIRSKLSLPDGWEGDLHDFYKALQAMTKPKTAKVSFLHRFNGPAEPFSDLPDTVADINRTLILPPECNAANMRVRMSPGWKFAGWALRDGTPVESDEYMLEGPVSLYAIREEVPVRVAFLDEAGETAAVRSLLRETERATIDRQDDPAPRWGWKFVGWRIKGKETLFVRWGIPLSELVPWDTPNDKLSISFEPVWELEPFTVRFEDGENSQTHKVSVVDMVPDVPVAEHPGWTSVGWSSEEDSANANVKAGTPIVDYLQEPATKAVFHAVRKTIPYTVTFLSRNAGSAEPVPFGEPRVGDVLHPVDAPSDPVLDHYAFEGWRVAVADGIPYDFSKPVTADTTLVAAWKPVPYDVRLGSADGELSDYLVGDPWTIERTLPAPPAPSAGEAYEFCHWTEQVPAEGLAWRLMPDDEAPAAFAFGQPVTKDLALYPVFRHRRYTVVFKVNNSRTWKTVQVLHGETIEDPGTPETKPVQLVLRYWQAVPGPSRPYDFSSPVTTNFVLSTIWQPKKDAARPR